MPDEIDYTEEEFEQGWMDELEFESVEDDERILSILAEFGF